MQRLMIDLDDFAKLSEIEGGKQFIVLDKENIGKLIMINCNEIQSVVISYGQEQEDVDKCTTK